MERQFYAEDVTFVDPLTSFTGIDKYQNNVDMLAGRTSLGRILFDDANIVLHNIKDLGENRIQTRWTLQVNVKFLPWKPRAKFTGVSIYTVSGEPGSEKVVRQEDYWDSVNLKGGKYQAMGFVDGLSDFLGQIFDNPDSGGAEMAGTSYGTLKVRGVRRTRSHWRDGDSRRRMRTSSMQGLACLPRKELVSKEQGRTKRRAKRRRRRKT